MNRPNGKLLLKVLLTQTFLGLLRINIRQRCCWQYEFVFDLRVVHLNLTPIESSNLPFVFKVKVYGFAAALLFATPRILLNRFFLNPSLKPDVEFPASLFQLLSSQILLIGLLQVVKCKEQGFVVKPLEVALPIKHG